MPWKRLLLALALFAPLVLGLYLVADLAIAAKAKAPASGPPAAKPVDVGACYTCHAQVKDFQASSSTSTTRPSKPGCPARS